MGIMTKIKDKMKDYVGESSGTAGPDYVANIRHPTPIKSSYSNGIFEGYNGKIWYYFKMPENVQVEWTKTYSEAADNQSFLTNVFNSIGKSIYNDTQSTRKDERIKFHIPMIMETSTDIKGFDDAPPAQEDFLNRMSGFPHPIWHSYFGVELQMGDINSGVYGINNKVRNYIDFMRGKVDIEYNLYKDSLALITSVCMDNGMKPLDFISNPEDFERLTAWFGEDDQKYKLPKELISTNIEIPEHGKSIFAGGEEMMLSAIKPKDSKNMFSSDPFDITETRFGNALLKPSLRTLHINIRGEIRHPDTAANIFDDKTTREEYKAESKTDSESTSVGERRRTQERLNQAEIASEMAAVFEHAWLDNVEITVANNVSRSAKDSDGRPNRLNEALRPYGLEAVNITKRQHIALFSTVPCYPNPIFKIPAGNSKRNPNVNNFYSGVLSMSGLFRSTKPAGPGGILLGLSDSGYEFKEIFTETDAAYKYSKAPLILVTGATGSGKTVQMLMMIAQTVYLGKQAIFLNPKPKNSLKKFFDMLGGETINMSNKYLRENPGLLDPMFFLEEREDVGRLLADMIIRAMGINTESKDRMKMETSMQELTTELVQNAKMPNNECSYDVIFGNRKGTANTPALSNDDILDFVRNRMETSPFWMAAISKDPGGRRKFKEMFDRGKPLLIEWDNSISIPLEDTKQESMTPDEKDGVQSIVNLFRYSSEVIGNGRRGGILAIDEAHNLKSSPVAMSIIKKSGREWRSADINLMLSTQNMNDFLGKHNNNISQYVRLFIIMKVDETDEDELETFFRITGLPPDSHNIEYISNAGINEAGDAKKRRSIPAAYIVDRAYDWSGAIICGPWPQREMEYATSKLSAAQILEQQEQEFSNVENFNGFDGDIEQIVSYENDASEEI